MRKNNSFSITVIFEDLIFLIILISLIFWMPHLILKSSELGCVISSGNYMINNLTLSLPFKGVFTPVNDFYISVNWLSDVILAYIFNLGGYQSIVVFASIIIAVTFCLIYRSMAIKNNNWLVNIFLLMAGIVACSSSIEADDRLFSLPLMIMLAYFLNKIEEQGGINQRKYICVGITLMIWANINTDFVFGLLIIMIYMLSAFIKSKYNKSFSQFKLFKQFVRLFALSVLLCLVNPYGIHLFSSLFGFYISGLYKLNGYLSSPDFHTALSFKVFEFFILLLIFLAAFSKYRPSLVKILLIIVFLFLSLYSAVNIPFFIILVLPVIAEVVKNTDLTFGMNAIEKLFSLTQYKIPSGKPITSMIIVFMLIVLSFSVNFIDIKPILANQYPLEAIEYVRKNKIHGRVFNPYGWGCYISNDLSCSVFVNERLYETTFSTVADYSTIVNIYKNYQQVLDKHKIDWVIIPSSRSLSLLLNKNDLWQKVYEDNRSCVYTRNKENE